MYYHALKAVGPLAALEYPFLRLYSAFLFGGEGSVSNKDTVLVGATVSITNVTMGFDAEYRIVGTAEADPFANRISNDSPVGKGLLGHKKGDLVEIETPGGVVKLKIKRISY